MGTFTASDTVERIRWDFTDTDSIVKGEKITGDHIVGELPEPDPDTAARFLNGYERYLEESTAAARASFYHDRALERRAAGLEDDEEPLPDVVSAGDLYTRQNEIGRAALVDLGVPSDLVQQLPARILLAFLKHVSKELLGEGDAAPSND